MTTFTRRAARAAIWLVAGITFLIGCSASGESSAGPPDGGAEPSTPVSTLQATRVSETPNPVSPTPNTPAAAPTLSATPDVVDEPTGVPSPTPFIGPAPEVAGTGLRWLVDVRPLSGAPSAAHVVDAADGVAILQALPFRDEQVGEIRAVDVDTGETLWSESGLRQTGFDVVGGLVPVRSCEDECTLDFFDLHTGKHRQQATVRDTFNLTVQLVEDAGIVLVADPVSEFIAALDTSGEVLWIRDDLAGPRLVAAGGRTVVLTEHVNGGRAVSGYSLASGAERWTHRAGQTPLLAYSWWEDADEFALPPSLQLPFIGVSGDLLMIDVESGRILWEEPTPNGGADVVIAHDEELILLCSFGDETTSFTGVASSTGAVQWQMSVPHEDPDAQVGDFTGAGAFTNGVIVMGVAGADPCVLSPAPRLAGVRAVDRAGEEIWSEEDPGPSVTWQVADARTNFLAKDAPYAYRTDEDSLQTHSFESGEVLWEVDLQREGWRALTAVMVLDVPGGVEVRRLDDGELVTTLSGRRVDVSAAIEKDGVLYLRIADHIAAVTLPPQ